MALIINGIEYKFYWDGGHSVRTVGKETPHISELGRKIKEAEFNHAVKDRLIALCKKYDIAYFDVSPDINVDIPLGTRVNRVNADYRTFMAKNSKNKAVVVSVHANAHKTTFEASDAEGLEVFYNTGSVEGQKLATAVHKELIKGTKQKDRGVKNSNFTIIAKTIPPAILVEALFMDSWEYKLMLNPSFQQETADQIFQGVLNYWGIKVSDLTTGQPIKCDCDKLTQENKSLRDTVLRLQSDNKKLKDELDVANTKITQAIYQLTK